MLRFHYDRFSQYRKQIINVPFSPQITNPFIIFTIPTKAKKQSHDRHTCGYSIETESNIFFYPKRSKIRAFSLAFYLKKKKFYHSTQFKNKNKVNQPEP